jgi:hypothetical protein
MEAASVYLYTLATLAVTFGGFAVIAIAVRQVIGGQLGKTHLFITRIFFELAIVVTVVAILPGLLALFKIPEAVLWRLASAIAAVPVIIWSLCYPFRRRTVTGVPWSLVVFVNTTLNAAAVACLAVNIAGVFEHAAGALYALAPTILLVRLWGNFIHNLEIFVRET